MKDKIYGVGDLIEFQRVDGTYTCGIVVSPHNNVISHRIMDDRGIEYYRLEAELRPIKNPDVDAMVNI